MNKYLFFAFLFCGTAAAAGEGVLGNVFLDTEQVVLQIKLNGAAKGNSVAYTVKDFWGQPVDSGDAPVKDGLVSIEPKVKARGYFHVELSTSDREKQELTCAVLAPVDFNGLADSPFGVVTHFAKGWNTDVIPLLTRIGISCVRDEQPWNQVEKEKGVYEFGKFEPYMAELKKAGIAPLIVMAFGNKHYDSQPKIQPFEAAPFSSEGFDGYANYCTNVLKHFGTEIKSAEIWNEYNGSFCKGKAAHDRPNYYTKMCKRAFEDIKKETPGVDVLGCAPVLFPLPYMEGIFKDGGLAYMDKIVIHPYRNEPEGLDRELAELNALVKKYNNGKTKPIVATEFGWGEWNAETSENAARNLVRACVLMRSQNVERMYWYLLKDFETFKTMGLLHAEDDPRGKYSPSPSCAALATLIRVLHAGAFDSREAFTPYTKTYVFKFNAGNDELRVCWSLAENAIVVVEADAAMTKIDIMGNESQLQPKEGRIVLALDATPFYLKGKAKSVSEPAAEWKPIANSLDDFSATQGANNWTYGGYAGSKGETPQTVKTENFKELTPTVTDWGHEWNGPSKSKILQSKLVPASVEWPAMRWTSSMDGKLELIGTFLLHNAKKTPSDGVELAIYMDGNRIFNKEIVPREINHSYKEKFQVAVEAKKGTLIDFVITPGPAGNDAGDNLKLDASICIKNAAQ